MPGLPACPQMGAIDESSVDKLASVCEFARLIHARSGSSSRAPEDGPAAAQQQQVGGTAAKEAEEGVLDGPGASCPVCVTPLPPLPLPRPRSTDPPSGTAACRRLLAAPTPANLPAGPLPVWSSQLQSLDMAELAPSFLWLLRDFQFQLTEDGRQVWRVVAGRRCSNGVVVMV